MGNHFRISDDVIIRDRAKEKAIGITDIIFYSYMQGKRLNIIGEIRGEKIKSSFELKCTVYDNEGDIIAADKNKSYGAGVVTSSIKEHIFYDGFPFKFDMSIPDHSTIKKIRIEPI